MVGDRLSGFIKLCLVLSGIYRGNISGATRTTPKSACEIECNSHWTSVEMLQSSQLMNATRGVNTIQTKRSSIHVGRRHGLNSSHTQPDPIPYHLSTIYQAAETITTVSPQPLYRTAYQPTPHCEECNQSRSSAHIENPGSWDHQHTCIQTQWGSGTSYLLDVAAGDETYMSTPLDHLWTQWSKQDMV